jgi:hypothetical protein
MGDASLEDDRERSLEGLADENFDVYKRRKSYHHRSLGIYAKTK